jgi:hypothetical protein
VVEDAPRLLIRLRRIVGSNPTAGANSWIREIDRINDHFFQFAFAVSISVSKDAGWSSLVARQAHNLKVASSNLAPATNFLFGCREFIAFTFCGILMPNFTSALVKT